MRGSSLGRFSFPIQVNSSFYFCATVTLAHLPTALYPSQLAILHDRTALDTTALRSLTTTLHLMPTTLQSSPTTLHSMPTALQPFPTTLHLISTDCDQTWFRLYASLSSASISAKSPDSSAASSSVKSKLLGSKLTTLISEGQRAHTDRAYTVMTAASEKAERVHCRVTPQNKALLKRAAALTGQDLTSFITDATVERALDVIERHERIILSSRDAEILLEALENPPEPSETLKAAAAEYKAIYKTQPALEYQSLSELFNEQ